MKGKTFAIGDIHGCFDELQVIMNKLKFEGGLVPERDVVVFLGDYIDRGKQNKKVVEYLIECKKKYPHWVFLFGNHEDLFYDSHVLGGYMYEKRCWEYNGGNTTRANYASHYSKEHLDFLFEDRVYLYENSDYVFVHAGLKPNVSIEEQENDLHSLIWIREEFIDSNYDWSKKVIFGHSCDYDGEYGGKFEPIIMKNKIGIDTAVCPPANNKLTAIRLPDEKLFFSN